MARRQPADQGDRHRHGQHRLRPVDLFESHRALFEREIPAFENLTALDRLPPTGAFVIALPMKITGGSGAPLRAVGILRCRSLTRTENTRIPAATINAELAELAETRTVPVASSQITTARLHALHFYM